MMRNTIDPIDGAMIMGVHFPHNTGCLLTEFMAKSGIYVLGSLFKKSNIAVFPGSFPVEKDAQETGVCGGQGGTRGRKHPVCCNLSRLGRWPSCIHCFVRFISAPSKARIITLGISAAYKAPLTAKVQRAQSITLSMDKLVCPCHLLIVKFLNIIFNLPLRSLRLCGEIYSCVISNMPQQK